jgi:hypothetical protein
MPRNREELVGAEEQPAVAGSPQVTPLRLAPPASPELAELLERGFEAAIGVASLAAAALAEVIAGTIRRQPEPPADLSERGTPPLLPMLAGAGLGIALETGRLGVRAASALARGVTPWASFAASPQFVRSRLERLRERARELDGRWREEQRAGEEAGEAFLRAIVPQVVDATLDQLDLTELVLARVDLGRVVDAVDLDRVVDRIDLDAIAARIDVERVIARVDLDRIVDRVDVARILDRIDLQAIVDRIDVDAVAAKLDLDAVAARLDVEAVVRRIDVAALAQDVLDRLDLASIALRVIDEIDLPQIVRESTGTMANETVEGIRAQGMSADRAVSRIVDRLLGREGGREDPGDGA